MREPGSGTEPTREPAVAGQFYAGTAETLREQIEDCITHEYGPGALDTGDGSDTPVALVSPHAGYQFSGPVAAHGFATIAEGDVDTAVVVGPNHEGVGAPVAVAPHDSWQTPLGPIPVDGDLAAQIVDASDVATFDDRAHAGEHSIEVQLPFLQYCLDDFAVVPICTTRSGRERSEQLGNDIAATIGRSERNAIVVSSTDLTHYQSHETAVKRDRPVVEAIESLDVDGIERAVEEGHSMCGPWATIAGLVAADALGAIEGDCLTYATSGELGGQDSRVVGYCSVAIQ